MLHILSSNLLAPRYLPTLVSSGNKDFVLKPMRPNIGRNADAVATDFSSSRHIRTHVDYIEEENALVFPYFMGDFMSLMQKDDEIDFRERIKVLRHVAEGLHELHTKGWSHTSKYPVSFQGDVPVILRGDAANRRWAAQTYNRPASWPTGESMRRARRRLQMQPSLTSTAHSGSNAPAGSRTTSR